MIRDQFLLGIDREMIVDLFAGGGGASTGIEMALGPVAAAIVRANASDLAAWSARELRTVAA